MSGEEVYTTFIEGELKIERERRTNLEGRGLAVVTQSGGLVTLLTGLSAFVKGTATGPIPTVVVAAAIFALVFFFGGAMCGILVNFPWMYPPLSVADKATMTHMRTTKRDHSDEEARSIVAHLHIGTLETIREGNDRKIQYVAAAQVCQILALVAVSVAVYVMITGA